MLAFLFPGQGSQAVGMGRTLAQRYSVARELFDRADEVLGFSLSRLCFDGPAEDLKLTANAQPAILTCSIAAWRVLFDESGLDPALTAGHSLGEYSALVCAGALEFEDAVRLVHLRGRFMQEAVPVGEGAMAALMGGDEAQIEALCREAAGGEVLAPANFNGAGQVVIAGHAAAVDRALAQAKSFGIKRAVRLPVSAPFHCSLMAPAASRLAEQLQTVAFKDPRVPVITNVEARPNQQGSRIAQLLIDQVTSPVRWEASVQYMSGMGVSQTIEIGPGKVLSSLVKRIDKEIDAKNVETPEQIELFQRQEASA